MKKILIRILLSLFTNICSMKESKAQESLFLASPIEVKLYIFESLIKNIIESNNIFEPFNNVKEFIDNISLINKEFWNLRSNLIKYARRHVKTYFASDHINLLQEKKDLALYNIFKNIDENNSKELEIKAAKLIIAGANPNLLIDRVLKKLPLSVLALIIKTGKFKNLVNLLIKYGADVNVQDNNGYTTLIYATMYGHIDIVKSLIGFGVDINKRDKYGYTALMIASKYGYEDIVKLLINYGVKLDFKDDYEDTALIWAVYTANTDIVNLLIKAGANVNLKNKSGNTALTEAEKNGHKTIVELLKTATTQNSNCTTS